MKSITNRFRTEQITKIGILAALSGILMYFEIPLPFMPPFLKMDLGDLPALIGSFTLGPVSGILIELVKNLIHLPFTTTLGAGELANFIVGSIFVSVAGFIYKYNKSKKGAIIAMASGTAVMTIVSSLINYFLLIPFYAQLFHISLDVLVSMASKVNALVKDMRSLIVFAFIPFNLFKGFVISLATALMYKKVSPLLHNRKIN